MAGQDDTWILLVQGLSEDVSQDALELHIEAMTHADVENVEYRNTNTEAIVTLNKSIKFGRERSHKICGRVVTVAPMPTETEVSDYEPLTGHTDVDMISGGTHDYEQLTVYRDADKVKVTGRTQRSADGVFDDATMRPFKTGDKDDSETFTETRKYPEAQRDLLEMLLPDLHSSLLNCSMKIVAEGIELSGSEEAVKKARLQISEQVFGFKTCPVPLDRLMQSDKSRQHLKELFSKAGIQAVLSARDDQLLVTAADDVQKSQASRMLERKRRRSEIPVDDFHREFLQSAQWKQLVDDLERDYTVTVDRGTSAVVIDALGDCFDHVLKEVCDKLEDNAHQRVDIQLTEEEWQLLKTYHQAEVEDFGCSKSGVDSVKVMLTTSASGKRVIQVTGDVRQLQGVMANLKQFVQSIGHKTVTFSTPGLSTYMSEGSVVLSGIQTNCKSLVKVTSQEVEEEAEDMEDEVETTAAAGTNTARQKTCRVQLVVKKGDLTTFKGDVLVNTPAGQNQDLSKCGQVSIAFCKVGGPDVQKKYAAAGSARDDVTVTQTSGKLKCKHLFHMRLHAMRHHNYQDLEDQIYTCLQEAAALKAKSIVFPTVGCGKLGYDPNEVVACFEHAAQRHGSDDKRVSKITIAAFDDAAYQRFKGMLAATDSTAASSGQSRDPSRKQQKRPKPPGMWQRVKSFFSDTAVMGKTSGRTHHPNTSFDITALGQAGVDRTERAIEDCVKSYLGEQTVTAQHIDKFTKREIEDITSLCSPDVSINIDTRAKHICIVGASQSVIKTAAAVDQKVQAIQTRPDFIRQTRGENAYREDMSKGLVTMPSHWKAVRNLLDETAVRVPVDRAVAKAIEDVVQKTWPKRFAGQGRDAAGFSHMTIEVSRVEQIENSHLYGRYESTRKVFCAHAVKGSYPKVSSSSSERSVLTSSLGISELDDQLIADINEHFLFHGAQQERIDAIQNQGIDFRLATEGMFGKGAYFCENSMKADQYADNRSNRTSGPHSMFLCKVILGHSHIAKAPANDLLRPPCRDHGTAACACGPGSFHDSVMGTHTDGGRRLLFREFVIYEQSQIYPAYLITYTRK